MDILSNVPVEVAARILSCGALDISDVTRLSAVCRVWHDLVQSDIVWQPIAQAHSLHKQYPDWHPDNNWRTRVLHHEVRARQLGSATTGQPVPPLLPSLPLLQHTTPAWPRDNFDTQDCPSVHVAGSPHQGILVLWAPDGPDHTMVWTIDLITHHRLWSDSQPSPHMSATCVAGEGCIVMLRHCVSHRNHCVKASVWRSHASLSKPQDDCAENQRPDTSVNDYGTFVLQGEMSLSGNNLFSGTFGPTFFAPPLLAVGPSWALMSGLGEWPAKVKVYNVESMSYVQTIDLAPALAQTGPAMGLQPMEMCYPQALAFDEQASIIFVSFKRWGSSQGHNAWTGNTVAISMQTNKPLWSARTGRIVPSNTGSMGSEPQPIVLMALSDKSAQEAEDAHGLLDQVHLEPKGTHRRIQPVTCMPVDVDEASTDDALGDTTGRLALSIEEGILLSVGPKGSLLLSDYRRFLTDLTYSPSTFCVVLLTPTPGSYGWSRRSSDATLGPADIRGMSSLTKESGSSRSSSVSSDHDSTDHPKTLIPSSETRSTFNAALTAVPCAVGMDNLNILWITPYTDPLLMIAPPSHGCAPSPDGGLDTTNIPRLFTIPHLAPELYDSRVENPNGGHLVWDSKDRKLAALLTQSLEGRRGPRPVAAALMPNMVVMVVNPVHPSSNPDPTRIPVASNRGSGTKRYFGSVIVTINLTSAASMVLSGAEGCDELITHAVRNGQLH